MTNGWQEVPLGKILKRADRFEKKDELQTYHFAGTYSFARGIFASAVKEGSTFGLDKIQRIKKGDFIYCKIMAWEGAFGIAPEKVDNYVMSGAFVAYEVDQTQIYPKFLDYYFKQEPVWKSIGSQSTGTNVRRRSLHPDQFEKATIPFPPLDEQHRIVERVEALAACIAKAQSLREEADEEASVFIASLSNQVLNELNAEKVPLGSVVIHARNGFGRRPKTEEKGPIVLRLADVSTGKISLTNPRRVEMTEEEFREFEVRNGDIIFVRVNGSLPIIGRCIPCDIDFQEKVTFNDHLIRARVDTTKLYSQYATLWLNSPNLRKLIQSKAITTAGQYSISQTSILSLPIKLPSLDEQRRIVAYLDSVQARLASLQELQSATGEELSALMPSILDKAFKGEL
jgi:type I restriction enzyme S subunit